MSTSTHTKPRLLKPELEHELARSPNLGYEPSTGVGFVRCLAHGFPTPLARWHYHDEYELHLITATSGKVFVGDWIGPFGPGQLVLTGPRLPHNWVTMDMPEGGVLERDLVIQFSHEPLVRASETIPELAEVLPLLERAKHGIEFFGLSDAAQVHWHKVKSTRGLKRFTAFCDFLGDLAASTDYRLLSSVQLQSTDDDAALDQIHSVVSRITDHLTEEHFAAAHATQLGMSESKFSRFFRKATGNTFTDFVNRVRISRACQLLMETDQQITHICYEVGFNNVANFNRRFLEIKGIKPSEFRKQSLTRFRGTA
jgi:AraC-like DNA-binding protein